jgi:hypothetical protein
MRRACLTTFFFVLLSLCACVSGVPVSTSTPTIAESHPSGSGGNPCLEQTVSEDQGATPKTGPVRTAIHLSSITTQPGAPVGERTLLLADLDYSVEDFEPGHFKIMAQFETITNGLTTDGGFRDYPFPRSAVGKLHFCFPLSYVWNLPNIKRPLTVHFMLNRVYESGVSEPIAKTDFFTFPSAEQGSGLLSDGAIRSDEYAVALIKVYSTFEQYAAGQRYCVDHFPELASAINEGFDRWTSKYSGVNAEVNSSFVKWAATREGGDPQKTQQMINDLRQAATRNATQGDPEQLRHQCRWFSKFIGSRHSDPEVSLSPELALIRRQENVSESLRRP